MANIKLKSVILATLASCAAFTCFSQDDFFDLLITVPEPCQQQTGSFTATFPLEIPAEIDFLIGPEGSVRPIAAIVNTDASGAGNQPALRAYKPGEYDISSGIVNDAVRNRIVISRTAFCDVKYSIQIIYELIDRHGTNFPKVRAYIKPGANQQTRLTPAAQALAVAVFDRKYGESVKYYLSDDFQWLEATKDVREKSRNNSLYALSKSESGRFDDCWNCRESPHAKSLNLARLLHAAETKYVLRNSGASPLASWPGKFTFAPNRVLILDLGEAGTLSLYEDGWNSAPVANRLLSADVALK